MSIKDPEKRREYNKKYYLDNKEHLNEASRLWRLAHPEKAKQIVKVWRSLNKERHLLNCRKNYRKHKDKKAETVKIWQGNNREKINKLNRLYSSKNLHKARAKDRVRYAIRTGKIKRIPCEFCGKLNTMAHHEDYSKPLDVWFLCPLHHAARHVLTGYHEKHRGIKKDLR